MVLKFELANEIHVNMPKRKKNQKVSSRYLLKPAEEGIFTKVLFNLYKRGWLLLEKEGNSSFIHLLSKVTYLKRDK